MKPNRFISVPRRSRCRAPKCPETNHLASIHFMDYHKLTLEKITHQAETPDGSIRLSGPLEHDNIVNGDGLRAVLWTQGCPNHCPGCQNPETWDYEAGMLVSIDEVIDRLSKFQGQTGLTFCGGEPFVQPKPAEKLQSGCAKNLVGMSGVLVGLPMKRSKNLAESLGNS